MQTQASVSSRPENFRAEENEIATGLPLSEVELIDVLRGEDRRGAEQQYAGFGVIFHSLIQSRYAVFSAERFAVDQLLTGPDGEVAHFLRFPYHRETKGATFQIG